jgi:hypothetical protein
VPRREGACAYRDQEVARLFEECGWTQERIAQRMGKRKAWVSNRLIFGRYLAFRTSGSNANLTERRFRDHWKQTKGREKDGPGPEHITQTAEESCGDVRYLIQARAILSDIRDIWGLNAPARWELDANVEGQIPIREVQFMRPAQGAADPVAADISCKLVERLAGGAAPPPEPPSRSANGHSPATPA